jgi:hypothetical protein
MAKFLTSWGTMRFSSRALQHGVSHEKMEKAGSSERLVIIYKTRLCHILEDSNIYCIRFFKN